MRLDGIPSLPAVPWSMRSVGVGIGLLIAIAALIVGIQVAAILVAPQIVEQRSGEITAFSVLGLGLYLGMLAVIWAIAIRRCRGTLADLGFRRFRLPEGIALAVSFEIFGLALLASYAGLVNQLGLNWLLPGEQVPDFARQGTGASIFLILASIVAPIAEESFFRGFVLPAASRALGFGWGLVLTSALFGIAHVQPGSLLPTFLLGLLLGLLYRLTGSIWPSILMHAGNNAIAVAVVLLRQQMIP